MEPRDADEMTVEEAIAKARADGDDWWAEELAANYLPLERFGDDNEPGTLGKVAIVVLGLPLWIAQIALSLAILAAIIYATVNGLALLL